MKKLIILGLIISSVAFSATKDNLNRFSSGDAASASDVMENFDDLADAIDTNTASIANKADQSSVNTNTSNISANTTAISNKADVSTVTSNAANISSLQTQVTTLTDLLPIGTIISSMLPESTFKAKYGSDNWVLADGQNVSGSEYANLLDNNVPDLSGVFLRGIDVNNTGRDSSGQRNAGSYQEDAFQGHWHDLESNDQQWSLGSGIENISGTGGDIVARTATTSYFNSTNVKSDGTNGTPKTSSETRPKNIAVYYYIKIN